MKPEELATQFDRIRSWQRQIQVAVYSTRMAAAYHIGKARDMVADNNKALALTGFDDVTLLSTQLPALVEHIAQLNDLADAEWAERPRSTEKLTQYNSLLAEAYDAIHLHPRVYERLVRQLEKPVLADARSFKDLPNDSPSRREIERFLRLEIEDYLALESEIASNLRQVDTARNAVVESHRELTDEYVRATGRNDEISIAAGRHAVGLATTRFDDRKGYGFMDYASQWIDRELDRVGQAEDS